MTDDDDLPGDLVKKYWDVVCWWARARRIEDFEDLCGDVFETAVQLWRKMPPDDRVCPEKWGGWLWTITQKKVQNAVRAEQRERAKLQRLHSLRIPHQSQSDDHADEVASHLAMEEGWRLLPAVDEPDRTILFLLWYGKSAQEIADQLHLKRGRVAMRISRLRDYFRHEGPHPRPREALEELRRSFETGES